MEGNFWLPAEAGGGFGDELTRSNSDVSSSLTAENCGKDASRLSVDVNPEDHTAWTDEKHNLYLNQLEVSFVKQLHQSRSLFMKSSEPKQREIDASQKRPTNIHNTSEQFIVLRNGCWQKINYERDHSLSRTSADSCNLGKSQWLYGLKRKELYCPPPIADKQKAHGKRILSYELASCSQKFIAKNLTEGDLHDFGREGIGQNFVEEDSPNESNLRSNSKRSKTANVTCYDQIVPSRKCPRTHYSGIGTSNSEEEHREFVSGNF